MKFLLSLIFLAFSGAWLSAQQQTEGSRFSSGKIAAGTDWETDYYVVDSDHEGPTVLIIGGMHGNEPAGARAAEQIRHWPIVRGKMVVVPRANVMALQAKTRLTPGQPETSKNLNRNFPSLEEPNRMRVQPQGELAKALWQFAVKVKPDWLIDLHEGYEFRVSHQPPEGKEKSVGSSVIYQGSGKMDALAKRMIAAADETVSDPDRKFSLIRSGPVSSGIAGACIRVMGAEGLILETTYNFQPLSIRTRQHRAMVNVLLNEIGMVEVDCGQRIASPSSSRPIQVGMFDGEGTGPSRENVVEVIRAAEGMDVHRIGAAEMSDRILGQFDVLVFPGGSGSKQARAISEAGRLAVQKFVKNGGGYVGVCAGAYLCSSGYSWSLRLVDSKAFTGTVEVPGKGKKQLWYRGKETGIDMELSPLGESLFGQKGIPKSFEVRYANGPIISPHGLDEVEDYQVLAWFRSENGQVAEQKGTMINTPAIVTSRVGKGRVMSVSPHPEKTPELHSIVSQAVRWVAKEVEIE